MKALQVVFNKYFEKARAVGRTEQEATEYAFENAEDSIMPPIWDNVNLCKGYAAYCNKYRDVNSPYLRCYVVINTQGNKILCAVNGANVADAKNACDAFYGKVNWHTHTITKVVK